MDESYLMTHNYPGHTELPPGTINTPAPTYTDGPQINAIAQRWMGLRGSVGMLEPSVIDFLERDVSKLITIARAAYAMQQANNAEKYRQATQQLMSALQLP